MLNYVYWGNQPNNNYRYGSALTVRADQSVHFVNRLMAPGKTLVKWHSAGNYQAQRVVPQLPELLSGQDCLNGLVRMPDGKVQFFENGVAAAAGLVLLLAPVRLRVRYRKRSRRT